MFIHGSDGCVPLLQTLPVAFQVKTRDGDFPDRKRYIETKSSEILISIIPGYDAVDCGSAVSYHEDELPIGEQLKTFKV